MESPYLKEEVFCSELVEPVGIDHVNGVVEDEPKEGGDDKKLSTVRVAPGSGKEGEKNGGNRLENAAVNFESRHVLLDLQEHI